MIFGAHVHVVKKYSPDRLCTIKRYESTHVPMCASIVASLGSQHPPPPLPPHLLLRAPLHIILPSRAVTALILLLRMHLLCSLHLCALCICALCVGVVLPECHRLEADLPRIEFLDGLSKPVGKKRLKRCRILNYTEMKRHVTATHTHTHTHTSFFC